MAMSDKQTGVIGAVVIALALIFGIAAVMIFDNGGNGNVEQVVVKAKADATPVQNWTVDDGALENANAAMVFAEKAKSKANEAESKAEKAEDKVDDANDEDDPDRKADYAEDAKDYAREARDKAKDSDNYGSKALNKLESAKDVLDSDYGTRNLTAQRLTELKVEEVESLVDDADSQASEARSKANAAENDAKAILNPGSISQQNPAPGIQPAVPGAQAPPAPSGVDTSAATTAAKGSLPSTSDWNNLG